MIHISLNPFALLILKLLGVIKKPPPPPFLFCCDQLSQTLSSAPMQPESALLLQIESSLPASVIDCATGYHCCS